MNSSEQDMIIRDKINSLDTLSGGIVFGKADAWVRLEKRMETKKKKRIFLPFLKAAAIILPILCISVLYFYKPKSTVTNNTTFNKKENNSILSKSDTDKLIHDRKSNLTYRIAVVNLKNNKIAPSKPDEEVRVLEDVTQNLTVCYGLNPGVETVLNTNVTGTIPMKTVYIDDFEKELNAANNSIEKERTLPMSIAKEHTTEKHTLKDYDLDDNKGWTATESVFDKSGYIINNVANCSVLTPTELTNIWQWQVNTYISTIHISDLEKGLLTGYTYQFNEDDMPYIDFENMPIVNVIDDKTIINKPLDEGELIEYADFNAMSIVYINDVEKDEFNKKSILMKENKFSYTTLPFIHNRNIDNFNISNLDWQHTINFLKFKINTQNQ